MSFNCKAYTGMGVQCWIIIHCLHDFAHKQDSQLNSSVLITVWRAVIEVWQDFELNSSASSHCSVWRAAIVKGVLGGGMLQSPADTRRWVNVGLTLDQRRRTLT